MTTPGEQIAAKWCSIPEHRREMAAEIDTACASAVAETGKWQPIETAPKDGTVILLSFGLASPDAGFWSDRDKEWPWVILDPKARAFVNGHRERGSDGWMPLPQPPQGGGR